MLADATALKLPRIFVGKEEFKFDAGISDVRAEDFEVAGEEVGGDEDRICFRFTHADGTDGSFEECAGAVVEGGIHRLKAGKLREGGLVNPVRD